MQKTEEILGIILKTNKVNEVDKKILILTRERGKISATAKGAYKNLNKWRTSFEPFSIINFTLIERSKFLTIISADENKNFKNIYNSYSKIIKASFMTELIDCFSYENNKDDEIFALLITHLEKLNDAQEISTENRIFFEFESLLLTILGYSHSSIICNDCMKQISDVEGAFFDTSRNVFVCNECGYIVKADIKISSLTKKLILNPITTIAPEKNVKMGISILTRLLEKASSENDASSKFTPIKKEIWEYYKKEEK